MQERDIFIAALAQSEPERAAYLAQACGGDRELRMRVEQLLAEHEKENSFFLDHPVPGISVTSEEPVRERAGTMIGRYKLLQQIGEGGFGIVFMAEQTEPVRRKVALKVIKPGMDTRQVIARFEAERQALALMDHVNIARVIDAGATGDSSRHTPCAAADGSRSEPATFGRPYFVMELVHGLPITKYCDDNHLTPRERLELFVPVCHAIQHAHQKGIIHRDIKPSNVLVTLYDGKPVPKVIDFGVAKATEQKLTERTLFTQHGTMVGTLEYMSPEQAEMSALGVDTRSDIYSLGVLLYELLTGGTPLSRKRMKEAAYGEILRLIKEEEPPKPSTRLSESGEALASISAQRHMEPAKLSKLMRGELDWIVMKTLEKDRNRRYETANGFAEDVERYLKDEPVQACPPSATYRLRKFARRNTRALATTAVLGLALLLVVGTMGWTVRDRAAREEQSNHERVARQAKVSGQLEQILDEVARLERAEKWPDALASARRAEPLLAADEAASEIQERVRHALADLELVQRLDEIRMRSGTAWGDLNPRQALSLRADQEYTAALLKVGIDVDSVSVQQTVDRITSRSAIAAALLPALDDWVAVRRIGKDEAATRRLIDVLQRSDTDPWRQKVRDALARKDWPALTKLTTSADLDRQPAATLTFLNTANEAGESVYPEPQFVLRRAQWKYPADFWINHRLGISLIWTRNPDQIREGIGYMRAAVAVRPQSAHAMQNLANGYSFLGQDDQAIACDRRALELSPGNSAILSNLGIHLSRKGAYEEAIVALKQSIELCPKCYGETFTELSMIYSSCPEVQLRNSGRAAELAAKAVEIEPNFSNSWIALGIARYREGQWQEARAALDKSLGLGAPIGFGGAVRWEKAIDWFVLAMCDWQMGQQEEARQAYRKAVAWMEENKPSDKQLIGFRTEAEELLGVTMPAELLAARRKRGRDHLAKGEFAQAVADFSELIRLGPEVSWHWCDRGYAYLRSGQHENGIADLKKAIEVAEREAYEQLGQWQKAEVDLSAAIKLKPDSADAWTARAWARMNLQQWDDAVSDYSRAIELAPKVHTNWFHRGHANLHLAQWDKAAEDFTKVVEGWPDEPGGWYLRAIALAQSNHPEQALADLRQAVAKGFKDAEQLRNETRLEPLYSSDAFQKLLSDLEAKKVAELKPWPSTIPAGQTKGTG